MVGAFLNHMSFSWVFLIGISVGQLLVNQLRQDPAAGSRPTLLGLAWVFRILVIIFRARVHYALGLGQTVFNHIIFLLLRYLVGGQTGMV